VARWSWRCRSTGTTSRARASAGCRRCGSWTGSDRARKLDLSITIAWSTGKQPSFANPERLRAFVSQSAEDVATAAAEPRLDLREIEGASGLGYYFQATIKAPPAGEWPHLTRGAIVVGDLLVTFTILAAEPGVPAVERALRMLKSARRVP
jgi:hypothetical protein